MSKFNFNRFKIFIFIFISLAMSAILSEASEMEVFERFQSNILSKMGAIQMPADLKIKYLKRNNLLGKREKEHFHVSADKNYSGLNLQISLIEKSTGNIIGNFFI